MCPQGAMMKDDPALGKTRDKHEPRIKVILSDPPTTSGTSPLEPM